MSHTIAERKMGGKPILRICIQESDDIVESLLERERGGGGGLADLVWDKYRGAFSLDLVRERCLRSDLLLQQAAALPVPEALHEQLLEQGLTLAELAPESSLFRERVDLVVLSVKPELIHSVWKDPESGYLLQPPAGWQKQWSPSQREWFRAQLNPTGLNDVVQLEDNFLQLVRTVKQRLGAHILAYNCSPIDPSNHIHNYHGQGDTLAVRVRKLNLALMRLSFLEGISIIDVERLVAELGEGHVPKPLCYSAEAQRAVCQEVLRVLEDIGFFEHRPLLMQIGQRQK